MKMSLSGLKMLKDFEGCILYIYKDVAGYPTIGIGHLLTGHEKSTNIISIGGIDVDVSKGITSEQAMDLLAQDIVPAEHAVLCYVKVPLNQNQFDALVSFTFNCGAGALQHSSLLEALNEGDYSVVPSKLSQWNKAGGKVCDVLVKRRAKEGELWLA